MITPEARRDAEIAKSVFHTKRAFHTKQVPTRTAWPKEFKNAETGKVYAPHHDEERDFFLEDTPRYGLARGGEGGGKSVLGIVKDLNRVRRGMDGLMVSPDLEHFKKSLWPEFRRWCPPGVVVERERYRLDKSWEPRQPFALHFNTESGSIATLYCGGIEDPTGWEGPNVNFAHFDEARRHDTPAALKVLDGRVRILGPKGEQPQMWFTTTPKKHWLFDYFGPVTEDDPLESFKRVARSIVLLTIENERAGNLAPGFTENRGRSLNEAEKRVLLEAGWEDLEEATRFLDSIIWWDNCKEALPELDRVPLVGALDAAVSGDTFGFVAVSAHPTRRDDVAVRFAKGWEPNGKPLDFDVIESEIAKFCKDFNVLELTYDPYQLHQMGTGLRKKRVVHTTEFNQGADRLRADKQLLDLIKARRVAHQGETLLRRHIDNADKKSTDDSKLRIVKRAENQKIDLVVCLSMAVDRLLARPARPRIVAPSDISRESPHTRV
jgi:terminase large subunit-like protein